jgi:hypothetical protein
MTDEWIKKLEKPDVWDQNAFNEIIKHGAPASGEDMWLLGSWMPGVPKASMAQVDAACCNYLMRAVACKES